MAMAIGNLWEEKIKMGGKLFRDFIIFELGQLEVVPCLAETFAQIAGTGMGLGPENSHISQMGADIPKLRQKVPAIYIHGARPPSVRSLVVRWHGVMVVILLKIL